MRKFTKAEVFECIANLDLGVKLESKYGNIVFIGPKVEVNVFPNYLKVYPDRNTFNGGAKIYDLFDLQDWMIEYFK